VAAASEPVALPELTTDANGSTINFSRALPSAPQTWAMTNVALIALALLLVAAATMTGTRLGRRFAGELGQWGPRNRTT
jgi:hypothetical protein